MNFNIVLNSVDKVKKFVNVVSKLPYDCDLVSGRYIVDAKSIMGIFSMNLSKPLELRINLDEKDFSAKDKIFSQLEDFTM